MPACSKQSRPTAPKSGPPLALTNSPTVSDRYRTSTTTWFLFLFGLSRSSGSTPNRLGLPKGKAPNRARLGEIRAAHGEESMRQRYKTDVKALIRHVSVVSLLGAGVTSSLDDLATAAEAPIVLHTPVIQGGAGAFAFLGVALYR